MISPYESLVDEALKHMAAGDFQNAKALLEEVVDEDPNNAQAWYLLSQVSETPEEISRCLHQLLDIDPNNSQAIKRLKELEQKQRSKFPISFPPKLSLKNIVLFGSGLVLLGCMCLGIFLVIGIISTVKNQSEPLQTGTIISQAFPMEAESSTETLGPSETVENSATATPLVVTETTLPEVTPAVLPPTIYSMFPCVPRNNKVEFGTNVQVIDGDTIKVNIDGIVSSVRYIGIDSPELNNPTEGLGNYSTEATEENRILVEGKDIYLIKDISETDRYDRLLRYVFVESNVQPFVNFEMVRLGYAAAATYPPDIACAEFFNQSQQGARAATMGLWGLTSMPSSTPLIPSFTPIIPSRTPTTPPRTPTNPPSKLIVSPTLPSRFGEITNCDPSYPTVCIPPPPPDLDCKDISFRRFKVLQPDPHNFDGNKDGVGCES